jgi:hypothetical protein
LTSFEDIFIEYKEANQHIVDQRLEILSNAQKIIVASETAKKYCVAFGIREDIINLISFPEYGNRENNNTEKHDNDSNNKLEPYEQRKRGAMLLTKYEKLMHDFAMDEEERIETFIKDLSKSIKANKEKLREEFESFNGTVLEFFELKRK